MRGWLLYLIVVSGCVWAPALSCAKDLSQARVLLLYSYHPTFPTTEPSLQGFKSAFSQQELPIIDVEFMDSKRMPDDEHYFNFERLFFHKINSQPPYDLLVAADDNAFNFLLASKAELFPGVPLIFWGVNNEVQAKQQDYVNDVTGVMEAFSFVETLDLIRTLLPSEQVLTVITDGTNTSYRTMEELERHQPPGLDYDVWSMEKLSWQQLHEQLAQLSKKDAILLIGAFHDAEGIQKSNEEFLKFISQNTLASVFYFAAHGMGTGILGGVQVDFFRQGEEAGGLANRVLKGESIAQMKVVGKRSNVTTLDYQVALQKGIARWRIPDGVTYINQPSAVVQVTDKQILTTVFVVFLLVVLSALLVYFNFMTRQAKGKALSSLELLQSEHSRLDSLLSAMKVGILFESQRGLVEYSNPHFASIWQIPKELPLAEAKTQDAFKLSPFFEALWSSGATTLSNNNPHVVIEQEELKFKDGRSINLFSYPVKTNKQGEMGRLWVFEDVTQQKQTADQLLYLAQRDPLTGLFNRRYFQEQLEGACQQAFHHNSGLSLIYIDLDNFKYINDTYGHQAGDEFLIQVATEISPLIRSNEVFARLGGDEFAIYAHREDEDDSTQLAQRLTEVIQGIRFKVEDQVIGTSCSLGVALYPEHASSASDLVMFADIAMYAAKRRGKNSWALFDPVLSRKEQEQEDLAWLTRVNQALEHDDFVLHYQGVYSVKTGELSHFEVLVRMKDPDDKKQLIMPGQFIPAAERSGAIVSLDRWVISNAIEVLAQNPGFPDLAVNISGRSFDDESLAGFILLELNESRVRPSRLIFELTETAAVGDLKDSTRLIRELNRMGCKVYLDDFGTGFSSFSYLKKIDLFGLKLDGQFISNISRDTNDQLFIIAMTSIAKGMEKKTVAEFVDNLETLQLLSEIGVDHAQGFLLDKPSAITCEQELEAKLHWNVEDSELARIWV